MNIRLRLATPRDAAAIRSVLEEAFAGAAEARLVEALRADGDLVTALVAGADDIVGYVAFSRLAVDDGTRAAALAPLAVSPAHQRRGVGAALVRAGLARLRSCGEELVLVLGDPAYYRRFGFTVAVARDLATPYDGPHLMALGLTEEGAAARGAVRYPAAFASIG